jgi:prepilin-type N-terminal cleavage/methylation domain-containing protein
MKRYAPITPRKQAFSLVELSIVLVILGLLIGGILSGQSLIRAAELRSVSTDYLRYVTAIQTFRDKYFNLPGDMTNAAAFWPSAVNGNGDGRISLFPDSTNEKWEAWKQMAFAGLVEGTYTGTGGRDAQIGINTPKSRISNAGWTLVYWNGYTDVNDFNPTTNTSVFSNVLFFGTKHEGGGCCETYMPALTPAEAWSVDTKVDDGKPTYGKVRLTSIYSTLANCVTSADATVAEYNLTNTTISCSFMMAL